METLREEWLGDYYEIFQKYFLCLKINQKKVFLSYLFYIFVKKTESESKRIQVSISKNREKREDHIIKISNIKEEPFRGFDHVKI